MPNVGVFFHLKICLKMKTNKKVVVDVSKKDILKKALASSENERLDLYKSILGGGSKILPVSDDACSGSQAYADSCYVKH